MIASTSKEKSISYVFPTLMKTIEQRTCNLTFKEAKFAKIVL